MYANASDLYITGTILGGVGIVTMPSNVGKYDGANWSQIGASSEQACYGVTEFGGDLYGAFSITAPANNKGIMVYTGGAWTVVFASANQPALAITVVNDRLIFVYGSRVAPVAAPSLQSWDGVASDPTTLGTISGGGTTGYYYVLASYLSSIYVGDVITVSGLSTDFNNIAKYSGGAWSALGAGISTVGSSVRAIAIVNSDVYVGGLFTTAGDKSISNLAVWVTDFQSLVSHLENSGTFDMAGAIHSAAASAITDNDEVPFWEDVANALRKITWANIKSTLQTFFNGIYLRLDASNDPITAQLDIIPTNSGDGGVYIETKGDAYTLDVNQFTINANVSSTTPALFVTQGSFGTGNIPSVLIQGQRATSGTGTITGPLMQLKIYGGATLFEVTVDGGVDSRGDSSLNGALVVNEAGADKDTRIEGDTEANLILVDASADEVYIGGSTNAVKISKGGDLTLIGTAKYERHVQIPVTHVGAVANQPTPVDIFTAGGDQYPTTGSKYGFLQWEIPDDWDGTDVYMEIDWLPDSGAISGTSAIRWTVEYRSIAEGETINNGTSVTLDNGAGGDTADYSQYQTKHTRFTLAYNDANQPLTKQDHIYFKISRDTSVANDFSGSVAVTAYEIIYQSAGLPTSN
jgi:hypothetical protein